MSKLWSSMLILVVALFVVVGSASAAEEKKKKDKKKGKRPSIGQIFKKLDADSDGKLTAAELLKSPRIKHESKAKEVIAKWDADKNGSVCSVEFATAIKKLRADRKKKSPEKK